MSIDRVAIYNALVTRLQGIAGFKSVSNKWRHWDNVLPEEQPVALIPVGNERPTQSRGLPTGWRIETALWVYCRNDADPQAAPGLQLAALLNAVETAFELQPNESNKPNSPYATTLGGTVEHCWITDVTTDEGIFEGQAVAKVSLEILTTA